MLSELSKISGQSKQRQVWHGLVGTALPISIAEAIREQNGTHVIVCADYLSAVKLHQALEVFLNADAIPCLFFPDWETLPYDRFSPHQDLISERLSCISRILSAKQIVIVTTISTIMHRLCPPEFLADRVWLLKRGQSFNPEQISQALEKAGYRCTPKVLEHGEFALRGGLVDVFPMGSQHPYRIDLFDETIESIRTFDPETQRTLEKLDEIKLLPAREFPTDETGIARFRKKYRDVFPGSVTQSVIYEAVSEGRYLSGIEYYSPLFFDGMVDFSAYLPEKATVFLVGNVLEEGQRFWKEIQDRYESYRYDLSRPLLPPAHLFLEPDACLKQLSAFVTIEVRDTPYFKDAQHVAFSALPGPRLPIQRQQNMPLQLLAEYIKHNSTLRILFVVESAGRREVLAELLNQSGMSPKVQPTWTSFIHDNAPLSILIAPFDEGVEWEACGFSLITEAQLFGDHITPQRGLKQKVVDPDLLIKDLVELKPNTPVVHLEHGIGLYMGLQTLDLQGVKQEFIELVYAGGDKIYVPVTALHCVTRYSGVNAAHATLNKLGTDTWQREKKKAAEKIHDVAVELLEIYAKRQMKSALSLSVVDDEYARFVSEFPFMETPDQTKAIQDILTDLKSNIPMDRLICGDVGFGKTEVAMRAAFIAVQSGKQVCVLVPTTLLAAQHYENFRDRFASFPIQIALISRFRSAKETDAALKGLKSGTVDIVIGTHKLFMRALPFKDLGLIIVDEEHRFGVKQKEYLKVLRHEVHCLTMTATPIPRTLNMAMAGMRDISLIATPPAKRLSIKTFWRETSTQLIREAVLREILRGGQVFYLHNEVDTIAHTTQTLQSLLPEASIQYAHGQMPERSLERIMSDFYHQRFNVLVCTTIIETGIDIPTANTIIIDRADLFGLAQLHQLRGRVGRSHHQAYAYLLTPTEKLMSKDAVKRLEAIVSLEDLGSGFLLASQDLEIRGAGELLGEEQSGNMHTIGFTLYMELLERAVKDLKAGKQPDLFTTNRQGSEVEVYFSALLPEDYVFDVNERLILYKRISNAKDLRALEELQIELIDRFGLLPASTRALFQVTALKLKAQELGIKRVQLAKNEGKLHFEEQPKINPGKLIELIQKQSTHYRMQGPSCLSFKHGVEAPDENIKQMENLMNHLK
jgi:transcription-repair coupling factor (superfamily II helicase)